MVQKIFQALNKFFTRVLLIGTIGVILLFVLMKLFPDLDSGSDLLVLIAAVFIIITVVTWFVGFVCSPSTGNSVICVCFWFGFMYYTTNYVDSDFMSGVISMTAFTLLSFLNFKFRKFCFPVINVWSICSSLIMDTRLTGGSFGAALALRNVRLVFLVLMLVVAAVGFLLTRKFRGYTFGVKAKVEDDNFVFKFKGVTQRVPITGDVPVNDKVVVHFRPGDYSSYVLGRNFEFLFLLALVILYFAFEVVVKVI